ncbi:c-type cytochrome [Sulfurimonas sp.]|uniref:c-type cytochrome n=1 Tax=Sulfurimonas sp. TaxID=2022749 RepID=UPI0025E54644|nr:c-type cytochrome [Sulfurimonas sp.]
MKIILSLSLALFLLGCSQESKEDVQKNEPKVVIKESVPVKSTSVVETVVAPKEVLVKDTPVKKVVLDAKILYKVCASCHGQNAQKAALGKSKIIKGWSVVDTTAALNGYKNGTYGGPMKAVMKGQSMKLNDEQILVLAEYISKL